MCIGMKEGGWRYLVVPIDSACVCVKIYVLAIYMVCVCVCLYVDELVGGVVYQQCWCNNM